MSAPGQRGWLKISRFIMPLALGAVIMLFIAGAASGIGVDMIVSTASDGSQANGTSYTPAISADGRYVAYYSNATNLVYNDTNTAYDVFVKNTASGDTRRVSTMHQTGSQANGSSYTPAISADGRYVTFYSDASNLVSFDTNAVPDVFVKDTQDSDTIMVSYDSSGTQANGSSNEPDISADGGYVAFRSWASDLVLGDTNSVSDIFVRDIQSHSTVRVSTSDAGAQAAGSSSEPAISANGRYVTFASNAENLVDGDSNSFTDVFIKDTQSQVTKRVSVGGTSTQATGHSYSPDISADGRYVVFHSPASNLVGTGGDTNGNDDVFIRDIQSATTSRVSTDSAGQQVNGASSRPSISDDGRYVTFHSSSSNLVGGDTNGKTDVFVKDRQTGVTTRLSTNSSGFQGNNSSNYPSISADGRTVTFQSEATNLVTGDANEVQDIFLAPVSHTYYFPWYDNNAAWGMKGNWIVVNNEDATAATVDIFIGASQVLSGVTVQPGSAYAWQSPTTITSGPVKVVSRNGQKLGVSQRVLFKDSFNEVEASESRELDSEYYSPWYDNNANWGMNGNWVHVTNVGASAASVDIFIGGVKVVDNRAIASGANYAWQSPTTINSGPVRVIDDNDNPLVVSQRVIYKDAFNETMGIGTGILENEAWFTWYDNNASWGMNGNWVHVTNVGSSPATVDIYVGDMTTPKVNDRVIAAGANYAWQSPVTLNGGPVKVVGSSSGDKLVVTQRVLYKNSFEETAPTYPAQMGSNADFTWYDNNASWGMNGNWVLVTNAGTNPGLADVFIAGVDSGNLSFGSNGGQAIWSSPVTVTNGPVRVTSDNLGIKLAISQRVIYKDSFNELVGRPR